MEIELNGCDALVMVGSSEINKDMYYATRFHAPDSFTFVQMPGESVLLVGELELGRARSESCADRVLPSSMFEERLKIRTGNIPRPAEVLLAFLQEMDVRRIAVPTGFPVGLADYLRNASLHIHVVPDPIFPARQLKTEVEINAIKQAMQAAEHSLDLAISTIKDASVFDGVLYFGKEPLTSELLRRLIHVDLLEAGFTANRTIVAGGEQGCDPHQIGTGPLRAGETIIIDIFPQSTENGYHGDITRTVVKGKASPAVRRIYQTVMRAQDAALKSLQDGVDGKEIHCMVQQLFSQAGYETKEVNGTMHGFFHGTGHGLGLDVHEAPSIGTKGGILFSGHVVTIEPGLYYPGVGAVRIEDTVVVRENGHENLTESPRVLEV